MEFVPKLKLNNGNEIPFFGLGTWRSKPGEVEEAVKHAIDVGYRQFDCARFYENEAEIGKAIREKIQEGVVKREDLFITSKLWCTNMRPDLVEPTLKSSLADLGLEYLDLYLIHWPCAFKYVDTWKAMEDVHKKGLAKSVGISNFNERQVTRLLENAKVVPVVNQVQIVVRYAVYYKKNGLSSKRVTSGDFKKTKNNRSKEEPIIKEIAAKYGKTPAQVIFRYIIQLGVIPIPKSTNKTRIAENINVFDFELTLDEISKIDALDCNGRAHPLSFGIGHPNYPFNDEY
ncbi:unnamed protein product [Acanthoscelides obtectus]|uniref:NADP-dependent oxidoreductase domain-containing protein n=1 Tax=Acanthoscelides obtectus TaxID=200917 RepID=A0A9P0NUU1_ACAOB|nr:unnamed protein product [Acanthoscelides obtectus]CAK1642849.1 1,5-anhydro-D-fructose reductase [Acanthoscelides obtectus]